MILSSGVREEFRVQLYEATPGDPNVPQGKPFASLSAGELGLPHQGPRLSRAPCLLSIFRV